MKTVNMIKLASLFFMLAFISGSCKKQENLFQFTEQPYPLPPPPPPLSNDLKNVELTYNGAMLKTSMIARRTFDPYAENPPSGRYCNGFEFVVRLDDNAAVEDYQKLQVRLPLDAKGELLPGIYNVKDNEVQQSGAMDIIYTQGKTSKVFPSATYSKAKDKFNFNLSLRLEKSDKMTHEVAGFIDELTIQDKSSPDKKIIFKGLGFTLTYDHFEIYLNDVLAFEGSTDANSMWYSGNGTANVYAASLAPLFSVGSVGLNISDFHGVGSYASEIEVDPDYGPFNSAFSLSEGTGAGEIDGYAVPQLFPVKNQEIKVETYLENVLIKGAISAPEAKLWGNNAGGYYPNTLIPSRPVYKLSGSFFQRQL